MWNAKTNKGRVVYERKPHLFTVRDVERIMEKVLEDAEKKRPRLDFQRIFEKILEFYKKTGSRFLLDLIQMGISGGSPQWAIDNIIDLIDSYRQVIDSSNLISWAEIDGTTSDQRLV